MKDGDVKNYWSQWGPVGSVILNHASVNMLQMAFEAWPRSDVGSIDRKVILCPNPPFHSEDVESWDRTLQFFREVIFGIQESVEARNPKVYIGDFRFKGFAKPFYCREGDTVGNGVDLPFSSVVKWLSGANFSPDEFEFVQTLFKENGQEWAARRIGFLQKEIETDRDWRQGNYFSSAGGMLSRWFIGYGYYTQLAIFWAGLFWVLGTLMFWSVHRPADIRGKEGENYEDINAALYSIDTLLPVIRLRERHYEIELVSWQRWYFYFHKVMGYFIGIFVFGGLTGLGH